MCDICHSTPCHPTCPNAPEEPVVCLCANCEKEIHDGDGIYEINDEKWCEDCISKCYTTAEVETYD